MAECAGSLDVDYHWDGDLTEKQAQLVQLFRRRLIPAVRRQWAYEGSAAAATGPDAESPSVRVVNLAFWREGLAYSRIELPVDVTRIVCLDKPVVRTVDGVVYRTASDADMVEARLWRCFARTRMEHRDLVDIFLFANNLAPDSAQRVRKKLAMLMIENAFVRDRLADFVIHRVYHVRVIDEVVVGQLDALAVGSIQVAGGGAAVLDAVLGTLRNTLKLDEEQRK